MLDLIQDSRLYPGFVLAGIWVLNLRVRILLACPDLRGIGFWKAMLGDDPDLEIVGEVIHPIDILLELGSTQAEVVVIDLPASEEDPGLCSHLLAEYPAVKVVAVSSGGETSIVYETGVIRRYLPDASPETLTRFIRSLMGTLIDNGT